MSTVQTTSAPGTPPDDRLWTAAEVARFLVVSESWVYQSARTRSIPCVYVGRADRFDPSAIRAYVRGETGGRIVQLPRCR